MSGVGRRHLNNMNARPGGGDRAPMLNRASDCDRITYLQCQAYLTNSFTFRQQSDVKMASFPLIFGPFVKPVIIYERRRRSSTTSQVGPGLPGCASSARTQVLRVSAQPRLPRRPLAGNFETIFVACAIVARVKDIELFGVGVTNRWCRRMSADQSARHLEGPCFVSS